MAKSEIQSWIASTSAISENSEDHSCGLPEWRRELVLSDWNQAMNIAQKRLFTSSTKSRIKFIQEELLYIAKFAGEYSSCVRTGEYSSNYPSDLTLSQVLDIFKLLTQTYPRYIDSASRSAVEVVGVELVTRDEIRGSGQDGERKLGVTEQIAGWLWHEAERLAKRSRSVILFSPSLI